MLSTYVAKLSRDELERRRLAAAQDLEQGMPQVEVARKYHAHKITVHGWNKTLKTQGKDGLKRKDAPGAEPKLTQPQFERLGRMILEGAVAHGYTTDLWTGKRIQRLIKEEFGVTYNPNYVDDLMRTRFGLSWQKPRRVARERDEAKRKQWLETTWPELKKGRKKND
ncbi:MAG TPA: winged helix-turn-helix domain-containing protein [Planctomycetota bacterium]|nr:winged helix-turn-helix domain-containing protein [Planctomycetota bacterium]